MTDEYSIFTRSRELDVYIRKVVCANFPKVHNSLRIELENNSLKLIKDLFYVYYNKGNIRNKYFTECLIDISMMDYLLKVLFEEKIVKTKVVTTCIGKLTTVKNILYAWKSKNNESR